MNDDLVKVRTTPGDVLALARQRHASGRVWTKLQRFFRRHCQPGAKFDDVDFRSSLIVLPAGEGWRLRGHLHCTPYLDGVGLLVRSGLSAPYVNGPSIGLSSAVVEDPDLQRTRCLPLIKAGHFQTTSELEGKDDSYRNDVQCALKLQDDPLLLTERHLGPRRLQHLGDDFENAVFQGAGDLSFNEWNVAFFNDAKGRRCFIPEGEPSSDRTYRCLVVFKPGSDLGDFRDRAKRFGVFIGDCLAVLELRFLRGDPWLLLPAEKNNEVPTGCIEFAIFGKSVLWDGDVVMKSTIIDQFRDIRHVFLLPDISKARKSRKFIGFGYDTSGSFWLLEAALRKSHHLARLACYAPITVPVHELGATQSDIEEQLGASPYYQSCESPRAVRRAGQYCLQGKELCIFLRPTPYPCTIVAIGSQVSDKAEPESLYLLAFGHEVVSGAFRGEFRLWEDCAQILKGLGARYALCMDEGFDVFQLLLENAEHRKAFEQVEDCTDGEVDKSIAETRKFFTVPPAFEAKDGRKLLLRRAMRATLGFWRAPRMTPAGAAFDTFELAVSVGGTKLYAGLVGAPPATIIARSGRIEWDQTATPGIEAFVALIAREARRLLDEAGVKPERIVQGGVAWPGPGVGGRWEATFIPGCQSPQPIASLLRAALVAACGPGCAEMPITIVLDAVARAAGEMQPGGALDALGPPASSALLVNVATGIAGALVENGRAVLSHRRFGDPYGQLGRFLFFNTNNREWRWRPTPDGSVPAGRPGEVRWTRHCAGPALARRIARAWRESGGWTEVDPGVVPALRHYAGEAESRHPHFETTLLTWATKESSRAPEGPLGAFLGQLAEEFGGALRVLTQEVFAPEQIRKIVLAGGVGENFGRGEEPGQDRLIAGIRRVLGPEGPVICRARLGVDAELLGFSSPSLRSLP